MKWAVVAAIALLFIGCASLPPILQRWADQEIATANLFREDGNTGETLYFSQDGRVQVSPQSSDAPSVRWRVRGAWLEIDTANDGTFQMRLRAVEVAKNRIVAVNPAGKRSVWRVDRVIVVIQQVPQRPGFWIP
jgi:hypothetical protein